MKQKTILIIKIQSKGKEILSTIFREMAQYVGVLYYSIDGNRMVIYWLDTQDELKAHA